MAMPDETGTATSSVVSPPLLTQVGSPTDHCESTSVFSSTCSRTDRVPWHRRTLIRAALVPGAVVVGLFVGTVAAQAVVTSPTPQEQPNLHQQPDSVLTICQDGNWDSDQLGSYQVEMGKWHNISSHVPTYNYVGTNCTSVSGKLWRQTTSACSGNWLGCTDVTYNTSTDLITYFDLTIDNNYCFSTLSNVFAYFNCYDRDTTIGHEAGHSIGLDHNQVDNRSIMYPTQDTLPDARSDPTDNDAAGIHNIYG